MMRRTGLVLGLAALHGGLCYVVTLLTLAATGTKAFEIHPGIRAETLVALSKLLYMPVLGLGLFPRQWFPGDLILIPLAVNSLIWGLGLYIIGAIGIKCFRIKSIHHN